MTTTHPLIGKPFTFYKDGKRRVIGKVIDVYVEDNKLKFVADITDKDVAILLGLEIKGQISVDFIEAT